MISVHPARWCTSPLGVVPAGLGDGVGHCLDAAKLPRVRLFISLLFYFGGKKFYSFFKNLGFSLPLGMLVATWVPTPCYHDCIFGGHPLLGILGERLAKALWDHVFPPCWTFLFGKQKDFLFFLGGYMLDAAYWEGQASWAWAS